MIISPISTVRIAKQTLRGVTSTFGKVTSETLSSDRVSFLSSAKGMLAPNEENIFKKILKGLFKEEILIHKGEEISSIKRFSVRSPRLYADIADGVFIPDSSGTLQNIVFQHHPSGSSLDIGKIVAFDMTGNLIKSLSPQQAKVLRNYRGNLATNLNSLLRYGDISNPLFANDLKIMDSLFVDPKIYSLTSNNTRVYRGVNINSYNANAFIDKIVTGYISADKGFFSTSSRKEIAQKGRNWLFQIDVPKGKKYIDMPLLTSVSDFYIPEEELLFDRGTRLFIKDIDNNARTIFAQML